MEAIAIRLKAITTTNLIISRHSRTAEEEGEVWKAFATNAEVHRSNCAQPFAWYSPIVAAMRCCGRHGSSLIEHLLRSWQWMAVICEKPRTCQSLRISPKTVLSPDKTGRLQTSAIVSLQFVSSWSNPCSAGPSRDSIRLLLGIPFGFVRPFWFDLV